MSNQNNTAVKDIDINIDISKDDIDPALLCSLGMHCFMTFRAGNISFIQSDLWPSNSPDLNKI